MEHALGVLLAHLSHVIALGVGGPPAVGYALLLKVLTAVEPAHGGETADKGAAADDDDDDDCRVAEVSHGVFIVWSEAG